MATEREAIRKMLENPQFAARMRALLLAGKVRAWTPADTAEPLTVLAGDNPAGIVGSKQTRCECGAFVWISPSTQEMLALQTGPVNIICVRCFERRKPA